MLDSAEDDTSPDTDDCEVPVVNWPSDELGDMPLFVEIDESKVPADSVTDDEFLDG
jgi:hypothetical protein